MNKKYSNMNSQYKIYNLKKIIVEELQNGANDLVTRQTGQRIRERIERELEAEENRKIVILDFSGVGIIDYSCADEIVAKVVARLIGNEYGDKYMLLRNLAPNQRENINVALERKNLATLLIDKNKNLRILGNLNQYLADTLKEVNKRGSITARNLADLSGVEINSASTKLLNLYKARLAVRQAENLSIGGREYVYKALF